MTGRGAIYAKEFREILSTYKVYVLPAIFLLLGLVSPITAKLAPDLIQSMMPELKIALPPPTAADAYAQLFKSLNQIAILVVIFSQIGQVAEEKTRGTAAMLLAKPVSRGSFIIAKYLAGSVLVLLSTALAYLACLYYTVLIFGPAFWARSAESILLLMAYYLLVLAVTLLGSTISRTTAMAGAVSVGGFLLFSLLPALHPWLARYSPGALTRYQGQLLTRTATLADAAPALAGTLALAILLVAVTAALFARQEL